MGWLRRAGGKPSAASLWAFRMRGPDASTLREEFEAWRTADPRHAHDYEDAVWTLEMAVGARRIATPPIVKSRPRGFRSGWRSAYGVAAMAVVLVGGAYVLDREVVRGSVHTAEFASADQGRVVTLRDGSVVTLGAQSAIRTAFDGPVRAIILLGGQARFAVAHDAAHPFVVTAGDRQVTARGTIFDVAVRGETMSVTMIEGRVEVTHIGASPDARAVNLLRGQKLTTSGVRDIVSPAPREPVPASDPGSSPRSETATTMIHDYHAAPLGAVLAEANRGARKPIRLGDGGLATLQVDGRLEIGDTRALSRVLAAALDLAVEDGGGSWILTRKP